MRDLPLLRGHNQTAGDFGIEHGILKRVGHFRRDEDPRPLDPDDLVIGLRLFHEAEPVGGLRVASGGAVALAKMRTPKCSGAPWCARAPAKVEAALLVT